MQRVPPRSRAETIEAVPHLKAIEAAGHEMPSSYLVMAHRPEILEAFSTLARVTMGRGTTDRSLKLLVAQMVSRVTGCMYCQAHTGENATNVGVDPEKVAALFEFETDPRFTDAERAALRMARDSAVIPNAVTDEHFEALREHFTSEQIVEIVSAACVFAFLNRYNDTLANDLGAGSIEWASAHLGPVGWEVGKHAPTQHAATEHATTGS